MFSKTILLADDDVSMRNLIALRLEVEGYRVVTAADGEEALQKIRQDPPALVIMDLMMPKIDGFEACRMIRFDDRFSKLPILVLSALNTQEERNRAVEAGADAVFIKPFDLNLLKVKIKELIA